MKRSIVLEKIAFEEYNRLCALKALPTANHPYSRHRRGRYRPRENLHAVVRNNESPEDGLRLTFSSISDLTDYMGEYPLQVYCVHPLGKWAISESELHTLTDPKKYLALIQTLHDVEQIILRVGIPTKRSGLRRSDHYYGDTFSFKINCNGMAMQRFSIHCSNFDVYDFIGYNKYLREKSVPFVRAVIADPLSKHY